MARYLLIDSNNVVENILELDPANIWDSNPCPDAQKIIVPQNPIRQIDEETGEPVLDEETGEPIMVEVANIVLDGRYKPLTGYTLQPSDRGNPGDSWPLSAPPAPNPNDAILGQILALEQTITTRRITDAIAGTENPTGWLANVRSQLATLRAQLTS